jgi:DNA-binding NarL/FixJ family response regulator
MQPTAADQPRRVVIIDDHPISRCACGALLRSEGVDVVAEFAIDEATADALRALRPDVVIVDARPGLGAGPDVARRAASSGCAAVLTSSARPSSFGAALDGFSFIAKADICRAALAELLRADPNAADS